LYLLVPLGLLPILSPSRLLVGLPLFVLLCLNELAQQPAGPFHHFHAPLLPIVLWAAASGLGRLISQDGTRQTAICGARFALACALLTGVCYTLTPLGLRF